MELTYQIAKSYYDGGATDAEAVIRDLESEQSDIISENTKDKTKLFSDCMVDGHIDPTRAYDKAVRLMALAVLRSKIKDDNIYKQFMGCAFSITMNASDFFYYATAMAVDIDVDDLPWVLDVVRKHPKSGLDACMSYIMQLEPIKVLQTPEFDAAFTYIKELDIKEIHSRELHTNQTK